MKAALVLSLVSLLASSARADMPKVGDYKMLRDKAVQLVKTMSREVVVFSYSDADDAVYMNPDHADKLNWIDYSLAAFNNIKLKPGSNHFGQGLYLAADPAIGKSRYGSGSDKWRMLKLSIRPGAKMFDLRGPKIKERFPSTSGDVLVDGCWTGNISDLFYANENKECKIVMRRLLSDLGITFFAYPWVSAQHPTCPKVMGPNWDYLGTAFVLTSKQGVDLSRTKYLTAVAPAGGDNASYDRSLIMTYSSKVADLKPYDLPYTTSTPNITALSQSEVNEYLKEKFFGCDEGKYAEDRIP